MPVEPATLGAFVIAVAAVVVSPGPDTMIILRYALASGRRAGFAAVAGVQLGLMVHTVLAVLGVSLIIASSPVLFKLVAVAGAAYLAWLGVLGFRGAAPFTPGGGRPSVDLARACRDGILTNLLNPKVILLFLALFPNFVDAGRDDVPAQLVTLAVVLIVVNVIWQAPLAWAAEAIGRWLGRPGVGLWVSRVTGGVLLAFAALLLYQHLL
ncbi:MAG: LysE family translocator [Proteobacteria bacterium]|nr:LysE family translocator [Pseudomonadota bacterium]MCH8213729.1 LysE family translocator [Pseudomonadota bacterium]